MINKTTRDIIALNLIPQLGPRTVISILNKVGNTEEIFSTSGFELARFAGVHIDQIKGIRSIRDSAEYVEEIEYILKEEIRPISYKDRNYPGALRNIYDPPPLLYCKGNLSSEDTKAVAIVGSRRCSLYGLEMAEKLAFDLAKRGVTVVSGMARGIDSAAHKGAIKAGGRTIAVTGSGFRYVYPSGSEKLIREISANGAVLTEYPSKTEPFKMNFPRRNRIISGMSKGVVVVEAARKSGALITADFALSEGKEVFAVPGRANSYTSRGTNLLIQNGAKLVMNADDVLEEIRVQGTGYRVQGAGYRVQGTDQGTEKKLNPEPRNLNPEKEEERKIMEILKPGEPVHIDKFVSSINIEPGAMSQVLLELEIKGLVKAQAGKNYCLGDKVYAAREK